jgi:hypothetical protein
MAVATVRVEQPMVRVRYRITKPSGAIEHLPKDRVMPLAALPRIGEEIEMAESGYNWIVQRILWVESADPNDDRVGVTIFLDD